MSEQDYSGPSWAEIFEAHFRTVANPGVWEYEITQAYPSVTQDEMRTAVRSLSRKNPGQFCGVAHLIAEIRENRAANPVDKAGDARKRALAKEIRRICLARRVAGGTLTESECGDVWEYICKGGDKAWALEGYAQGFNVGFKRPQLGTIKGMMEGIGNGTN